VLELHTLGVTGLRTRVTDESTSLLLQPKRLALLIYLALAPRRRLRRRDQLVSLFWPELDSEHARGALSQGLKYLRRAMGDGIVIAQGEEEVGANRDALWCDAFVLAAAAEAGDHQQVVSLYKGVFLDGFFVEGSSPEYERWVSEERNRLAALATGAAMSLASRAEQEGDLASAVRWAHRAASIAPNDESAVRRLIDLLARSGDRMGALNTYEAFRLRLRQEFQVAPSKETTALIARILET
jgi:DNA-binding SARP family transcriptional activator